MRFSCDTRISREALAVAVAVDGGGEGAAYASSVSVEADELRVSKTAVLGLDSMICEVAWR